MDDLTLARAAARAGADVVRSRAGRFGAADYKAANDPVTVADRESEEAIVGLLRRERPDDAIVAEEGATGADRARRRWLVDPLDGTVNFMIGVPHVGVSIALYEGDRPLVGVVVDIFRDEEFTAVAGDGARHDGEPLQVSGRPSLDGAVVATGFPYDHRERDYTPPLRAVLGRVQGVRRMGTASLDFAWVAAGRFDGFWELGLSPWDTAAGLLLVAEAGGKVTSVAGEPATPETRLVIASNGRVHDELRALVAGNLPAHLA